MGETLYKEDTNANKNLEEISTKTVNDLDYFRHEMRAEI
jgi:hypothetical protein